MSYIEIFQSSRYIDYDYDNECIFGFNADDEDNNMIFGNLANKNNSKITKLTPLRLPVELIGDSWWRKDKRKDKTKTKSKSHNITKHNKYLYFPRTPSPVSPQTITTQTILTPPDTFDENATDKRIKLACSDPDVKCNDPNYTHDTIVRSDKSNGQLYETHGTQYIFNTYKWKFILHDDSECIIGLIDADIIGKQSMNIFIDFNEQLIKTLFTNGAPKEGCVIQITYDKQNKLLLCKNITNDSTDYGKEIICVRNINMHKRYKLTVLLHKESTVTMF